MADSDGGFYNQVGVEFECEVALGWVLRMLAGGDVEAVVSQPRPGDADHRDVRVDHADGTSLAINCKRRDGDEGRWTLNRLATRGVLAEAAAVLTADPADRFIFASEDPAPALRRLVDEASTFEGDADAFETRLPGDPRDAFQLWRESIEAAGGLDAAAALRRVQVVNHPRDALAEHHELLAASLFEEPGAGLSVLRSRLSSSPRVRVTAAIARGWLADGGARERGHLPSAEAAAAAAGRREAFRAQLRPLLIRNGVLEMPTVDEIVDAVSGAGSDAPALHWILGGQGSGKSVIALDVMDRLDASGGFEVLPIRLDTCPPGDNAVAWAAEAVGLPASPARTLHAAATAGRRPVLLLDQVDAVRWTASHRDSAAATLRTVVAEAIALLRNANVVVIAACRSFDLNGEPGLATLQKQHAGQVHEVPPLPAPVAAASLGLTPAAWDALPAAARSLLSLPQGLWLWHQVHPDGGDPATATGLANLTRRYFDKTEQLWKDAGGAPGGVRRCSGRVSEALERRGSVSVGAAAVQGVDRDELERLVSVGVLREAERGRVAFQHQTLGEFVAAEAWLAEAEAEKQSLAHLLKFKPWGLLKRERLRQVLWLMRERERPARFASEALEALEDPGVRFHLKATLLEFFGTLTDPTPAEARAFCRRFSSGGDLANRIGGRVLHRDVAWSEVAVAEDLLDPWLDGEDEDLRRFAVRWLCFAPDGRPPAFALGVLEKRVVKWAGDDDRARMLAGSFWWFAWDVGSDGLFELRLRHTAGVAEESRYTDWKKATKQHPARAVRLLAAELQALISIISSTDGWSCSHATSNEWQHGAAEMVTVIEAAPREALERLMPPLRELLLLLDQPREDPRGWAKPKPLSSGLQEADLARVLEELAGAVAAAAAATLPQAFLAAAERAPSGVAAWRFQRAVALGLASVPARYAERALRWLAADADRMWSEVSRESQPRFANQAEATRRFFDAHVAALGDEAIRKFSDAVMALSQDEEWEEFRRFKEAKCPLPAGRGIGRQRYGLLASIPVDRFPSRLHGQQGVWQRRFGPIPSGEAESRAKGGRVRSAIPMEAAVRLSNRGWLDVIEKLAGGVAGKDVYLQDAIVSSSPLMLGRSLGDQARLDPTRFVRLSERFPAGVSPHFVYAVLSAAALSDREDVGRNGKNLSVDEPWEPAPFNEVDALVRRVGPTDDGTCAGELCRILRNRRDGRWSAEALSTLSEIATGHPDPKDDAPIAEGEEASAHELETRAINRVRAVAALAVAAVVHGREPSDREVSALEPAIIAAATDPVASVRVSACRIVIGLLEKDHTRAVGLFFRLIEEVADLFWGTEGPRLVIAHAYRKHTQRFDDLLTELLARGGAEGKRFAATWTAGVWAYNGHLSDASAALADPSGDHPAPLRAAHAGGLAGACERTRQPNEVAERLVTQMNDPDADVRAAAGEALSRGVAWKMDQVSAARLTAGWLDASARLGFPETAFHHLRHLQENAGTCRGFVEELLAFCHAAASGREVNANGRDPLLGHIGGTELGRLLFTASADAEGAGDDALNGRCLDAWDALLAAGVFGDDEARKLLDSALERTSNVSLL